jgi:glycerol-3-phosphate cytidylyltransferase
MEKIALTYGTFDLFHIGHLRLLQKIKDIASKVIVAVSTDEFNLIKGKNSIISFSNRFEIINNIKCVDLVISENSWEQKIDDIKKYNVDVLVMGNDWEGKFDNLKEYCDVKYLNRTEGVSSTTLRNSFQNLKTINFESLDTAVKLLEQIKKELL